MNNFSLLLKKWSYKIDWILLFSIFPIIFFGLITMYSFTEVNPFFVRQLIWVLFSLVIFIILSLIDFKFLRRTEVIISLYLFIVFLLIALFLIGSVFKGAQSWFNFGFFAFQPSDLSKLILILVLSKYFSRRHIEIKNIRHIIVSGVYAFIIFLLVVLQPDFGSAIIILSIWFGMILVSGISKKHLFIVLGLGFLSFLVLWNFVFLDYQKQRVITFINPLYDIQGTGYNAYQSMITVGSGQFFGKGIGYGTQSRLQFLPEYETDFIFAAFAEEWGFIGIIILFSCYTILIWRILVNAQKGATNFETFFAIGLAILFISHFIIHVGMNIGLLPVTGLNLPFMSYGGTNMLISFIGIGILMSMRKYSKATHRNYLDSEIVGL